MAELRAQQSLPNGYVALGHKALAARLGCDPRTARRRLVSLAAQQGKPEVLRVVKLPVAVGKGAKREALHVLWPTVQCESLSDSLGAIMSDETTALEVPAETVTLDTPPATTPMLPRATKADLADALAVSEREVLRLNVELEDLSCDTAREIEMLRAQLDGSREVHGIDRTTKALTLLALCDLHRVTEAYAGANSQKYLKAAVVIGESIADEVLE